MNSFNKSFFVSFEGPDGAGKSTVIAKAVEQLAPHLATQYLVTREPGGSQISEKIRHLILDPQNQMSAETEALLYAASRSQHMNEVILPALAAGKVVISDRFVDSSLAYQGVGRKLGIDQVKQINDFATSGVEPDLTLFLDVAPEVGLGRIAKLRSDHKDRMEQEQLAFHEQVYAGYQEINQRYSERIKVVDAGRELGQVVADCVRIIANRLPQELLKD